MCQPNKIPPFIFILTSVPEDTRWNVEPKSILQLSHPERKTTPQKKRYV